LQSAIENLKTCPEQPKRVEWIENADLRKKLRFAKLAIALQEDEANLVWTSATAMPPSPTAAAQRFTEPERTSPAAKIPGRLVSSRPG